jgi:hypothetical protein
MPIFLSLRLGAAFFGVILYSLFIWELLLFIFFFLILVKIFNFKNHFLIILLNIEFLIISLMISLRWLTIVGGRSISYIFLFRVLMVGGACLGLTLLVIISRVPSIETELVNLKV